MGLPAAAPIGVLSEMCEVGLLATELGPEGFLPTDPAAMAGVLSQHGLQAVGGFTPLLLHLRGITTPSPRSTAFWTATPPPAPRSSSCLPTAVSPAMTPAPQTGRCRLGHPVVQPGSGGGLAGSRGMRAVLHPHVGTMIEKGHEVQQVLDGSWISLCLDTGHMLIGGTDPAELARQAPDRIAQLHLKDVDSRIAAKVQSGLLTYSEAVGQGMYRPLGTGDVDVPAIVGHVLAQGYDGWYTLEQDTILTEEPTHHGPVKDVAASAEYLRTVLRRTG